MKIKSEFLRDLLVIQSSLGVLLLFALPDIEMKAIIGQLTGIASLIIMLLAYIVLGKEVKELDKKHKDLSL